MFTGEVLDLSQGKHVVAPALYGDFVISNGDLSTSQKAKRHLGKRLCRCSASIPITVQVHRGVEFVGATIGDYVSDDPTVLCVPELVYVTRDNPFIALVSGTVNHQLNPMNLAVELVGVLKHSHAPGLFSQPVKDLASAVRTAVVGNVEVVNTFCQHMPE